VPTCRNPLGLLCVVALLAGACSSGDSLLLPSEGEPASIKVVQGDSQSGRVTRPLAGPVVVAVSDSRNRPVEGATVTFELTAAGPGADIIPHTATTNANGEASTQVVLGNTIGRQMGAARVSVSAGVRVPETSFSAMALSENANSMAAVAGEDQAGRVGSPLGNRLVVAVTDTFGNPIAGVPIDWTAGGGGSVSAPTVITDDRGQASVERILGSTAGQQTTVASSKGLVGSPVTFVHTALAGDASLIAIISGNDQTGQVGTELRAELVVRVIDGEGNGVAGTAVTWTAAVGGGTVSSALNVTDQEGRASARWVLGSVPGANRLDAAAPGAGAVSFQAVATAGAPAALSVSTQPAATARNGLRLDRQPVVQLRDAGGNMVARAGIPVSAALGTGSGTLAGTRQRITDENGRATFTDLAISGSAGRYTLVFSAGGFASVTSNEIDLRSVPTVTTITGDSPDPTPPGGSFTVEFTVSSEGATPSGSVTVSDGVESCSGTLSGGSGRCQLALSTPGERTLRATYSGGPGLEGSSGTATHRVDAPQPGNRSPVANYDWNCTGLTCQFTDRSADPEGNIATRSWNFGDGSGAVSDPNPTHSFPASGNYTVTLTVTDNDGAMDDVSADVPVQAPAGNQPPTVGFTAECRELGCRFNSDGSRDPDGRIVRWFWSFGDDATSEQRDPNHDYAAAGNYTVTLTVTDDDGASGQFSNGVTVTQTPPPPNQAPIATFSAECRDLGCKFNSDASNDPDGRIVRWLWSFGDGATSEQRNPDHDYAASGNYTVTLTVTDGDGASGQFSNGVTVTARVPDNRTPDADFDVRCTDLDCSFTDKSKDEDGSLTSWQWTFGDGEASSDRSPTHHYSAPGRYQVTLTVTDNNGASDSRTREAQAESPPPQNQTPAAGFTSSCNNLSCGFTDQSSDDGNIAAWSWEYGDGGQSNEPNPSHTYSASGTYSVRLTVTDNQGAVSSVTNSVTVTAPPPPNQSPTAAFTSSCSELVCDFTDQSTDGDGSVTGWSWDFGDGTTAQDVQNPTHTYAAAGEYTVTLTATDGGGLSDGEQQTVTVAPPTDGS
jgi:PKD repeat protein